MSNIIIDPETVRQWIDTNPDLVKVYGPEGWWAVSDEDGVFAYFEEEWMAEVYVRLMKKDD